MSETDFSPRSPELLEEGIASCLEDMTKGVAAFAEGSADVRVGSGHRAVEEFLVNHADRLSDGQVHDIHQAANDARAEMGERHDKEFHNAYTTMNNIGEAGAILGTLLNQMQEDPDIDRDFIAGQISETLGQLYQASQSHAEQSEAVFGREALERPDSDISYQGIPSSEQ